MLHEIGNLDYLYMYINFIPVKYCVIEKSEQIAKKLNLP